MKKLGILILLLVTFTHLVNAQPDYTTEGKVFTSLKEASLQPDSVFRLKLRRKNYKEIPPEILKFKNLRELDLISNNIKRIPSDIGKLEKLEILRLERNQIDVVGKEIGNLPNLKYLDLGKNRIQALPYEIGNLSSLEFLQIWGNEITLIPESIQKLEKLKYLDMRAILLTESEKEDVLEQLPNTEVLLSPGCNCGK